MAEDAPKQGMERKDKIVLIALILGAFMTALDATIVSVAIPTIAREMGEAGHDTSNISWILLIYTLFLGCFVLLWSKLGTNKGYKKVFMTGITVFTATSLAIGACGFIEGIGLNAIIALRGLQGLGAGMAMSMSLAMTTTYLPASVRGSAIGAVTLSGSCGTAFGPALGGVLTSFHWSYIFFINVPIGLVCILLCLRYMKVQEKLPENAPRLDIIGTVLMVMMMFSIIFYLNQGEDLGWMSDISIAILALAAVSAGLLFWWEQRISDPLVSMRLIRDPNILRANVATMLLFMAMAGSYLLLPYYLGYVKGMETAEYGFVLIANSVGMMAAGPLVGRITDRTGNYRVFAASGAIIAAVGFFLMMGFGKDTNIAYILLALFVMGAGVGMAMVASTNLAYGFAEPSENGQLSGQITTFRQAGSSSGVAVLNAVFMANIALGAGSVGAILLPGFRHAFFIAVVMSLAAFAVVMGARNAKDVLPEDSHARN